MNSCSCVYICHDDNAEILKEKIVTAKRNYTCCECGKTVLSGERHEYVFGIGDGAFSYRTCLVCVDIRDHFFCDGWTYTMVFEDLRNHFYDINSEISHECLLALPEPARWKVMELIDETFERINRLEILTQKECRHD